MYIQKSKTEDSSLSFDPGTENEENIYSIHSVKHQILVP